MEILCSVCIVRVCNFTEMHKLSTLLLPEVQGEVNGVFNHIKP